MAGRPLAVSATLREQEVIRLLSQGKNQKEVARLMSLTPATVQNVLNRKRTVDYATTISEKADDRLVEELVTPTDPLKDRIDRLALRALDILEDTLEGRGDTLVNEASPREVLQSVGQILQMAGYGKNQEKLSQVVVNQVDLSEVATAIREVAQYGKLCPDRN